MDSGDMEPQQQLQVSNVKDYGPKISVVESPKWFFCNVNVIMYVQIIAEQAYSQAFHGSNVSPIILISTWFY